jgi:hypothetical protein
MVSASFVLAFLLVAMPMVAGSEKAHGGQRFNYLKCKEIGGDLTPIKDYPSNRGY